jgi:hypothetical protein
MVRRVSAGAAFLIATLSCIAAAQPSTASVRRVKPWTMEVGAGFEGPITIGESAGDVFALHGGTRVALAGSPAGIRLGGYWIRRGFSVVENGQKRSVSQHVLGAAFAADVEIPIAKDAAVAPFAGVGLAPYVHASAPHYSYYQHEGTGSGTLWTLGLSLRVGKLLVQQHLIGLLGADFTIPEYREYYPLTIGWRF